MSEVVRLYRYKSLLSSRRAVSAEDLMAALEVSRATLKRDIAKLRDQLHVPILFNRDLGGYTLEQGHTDSELPGLWFSQEEILALVTIQQLLEQLEPGLLGTKLRPLQDRLTQLMDKHGLASQDVAKRNRKQLIGNALRALAGGIAGLPANFMPLFAGGRTAFVPVGDQVVVHGGVSVEELIVPFVKVNYLIGTE